MLQEERKHALLGLMENNGYCTVEYLAAHLYTSRSTVRRNLAELERQGLVKRSYGGAELCQVRDNIPVQLRYHKNHQLKEQIARRAAAYVRDGMVLFLDASSTCLHMVPYLRGHKDITVYTNGLEVCGLLSDAGIPTYCLGGALLPRSRAFVGESAIEMARQLYFDALFFSCSGYDGGVVTDYSQAEAHLRRVLLQQARQKFFLCDSTKHGKRFPHIICRESDMTQIITDLDVL